METAVNINWNTLAIYHEIQPIVELQSNKIHGYEFLLRSNQSANPELLFSNAIKQNALLQLDSKSIYKVLEDVHQLESKGLLIFINVYPSTFVEPIFFEKLLELITFSAINPNSIVLELNESKRPVDLIVFKRYVRKYREVGFIISMDDLGKKEATIKAMLEIKPDLVKLDRFFAKNLTRSKEKQKIIRFLLELLHDKTTMVLEGIENKEDLLTAQKLGVSLGQGYFLGRPKPIL